MLVDAYKPIWVLHCIAAIDTEMAAHPGGGGVSASASTNASSSDALVDGATHPAVKATPLATFNHKQHFLAHQGSNVPLHITLLNMLRRRSSCGDTDHFHRHMMGLFWLMFLGSTTASCPPPTDDGRLAFARTMRLPERIPIGSSASPNASLLLRLGFLSAWDFNQQDSLAAFEAAARIQQREQGPDGDPECCMCHVGIAYAYGPFLNKVPGTLAEGFPVYTKQDHQRAHQAAHAAHACAARQLAAAPHDAALRRQANWCFAATLRFPKHAWHGPGRTNAERAYAQRMERIAHDFADVHALAMAVEGYMNNNAWDFWANSSALQLRQPDAQRAHDLLRAALDDGTKNIWKPPTVSWVASTIPARARTTHPLLLHLHIHLMEGVPQSGGAWAQHSADTLALRFPGAGHLLHMPSHTYLRVGRWKEGVDANVHAHTADDDREARCMAPYLPSHNVDVLIMMASMAGRKAIATRVARQLRSIPQGDPVHDPSNMMHDYVTLLLVQLRFADWTAVDAWPLPDDDPDAVQPIIGPEYARVVWAYGRALRALANGSFETWLLDDLDSKAAAVPLDMPSRPGQGMGIWTPAYQMLSHMYVNTTRALVALRHSGGDWDAAIAVLRHAVDAEASTGYTEPPRIGPQPIAQCLGYVLLAAGFASNRPTYFHQALEVYRSDLQEYPHNGWSLKGLAQAYAALGDTHRAAEAERAHIDAFEGADVVLQSSCPSFGELLVGNAAAWS